MIVKQYIKIWKSLHQKFIYIFPKIMSKNIVFDDNTTLNSKVGNLKGISTSIDSEEVVSNEYVTDVLLVKELNQKVDYNTLRFKDGYIDILIGDRFVHYKKIE